MIITRLPRNGLNAGSSRRASGAVQVEGAAGRSQEAWEGHCQLIADRAALGVGPQIEGLVT